MPEPNKSQENTPSADQIQDWLIQQLADRLRLDAKTIDAKAPLTRYGLDSAEAASLSYELEIWLKREIFPSDIVGAASIADLAARLAEAAAQTPGGGPDGG